MSVHTRAIRPQCGLLSRDLGSYAKSWREILEGRITRSKIQSSPQATIKISVTSTCSPAGAEGISLVATLGDLNQTISLSSYNRKGRVCATRRWADSKTKCNG